MKKLLSKIPGINSSNFFVRLLSYIIYGFIGLVILGSMGNTPASTTASSITSPTPSPIVTESALPSPTSIPTIAPSPIPTPKPTPTTTPKPTLTPKPTPHQSTGPSTGSCSGPDKDCGDFATHAQAQAFFLSCGGPGSDPHGLDRDHDGDACETLP